MTTEVFAYAKLTGFCVPNSLTIVFMEGRKPIETERRNNVFKLAAEGSTRAAIATQLGVGEATVYRILASVKVQDR